MTLRQPQLSTVLTAFTLTLTLTLALTLLSAPVNADSTVSALSPDDIILEYTTIGSNDDPSSADQPQDEPRIQTHTALVEMSFYGADNQLKPSVSGVNPIVGAAGDAPYVLSARILHGRDDVRCTFKNRPFGYPFSVQPGRPSVFVDPDPHPYISPFDQLDHQTYLRRARQARARADERAGERPSDEPTPMSDRLSIASYWLRRWYRLYVQNRRFGLTVNPDYYDQMYLRGGDDEEEEEEEEEDDDRSLSYTTYRAVLDSYKKVTWPLISAEIVCEAERHI